MELKVVGAGVGRTGTHSLKLALEQLLNAPCHHMLEILGNPDQIPAWIDAIEGRPVDWSQMLERYEAIVDWPGGSFWRELSQANPDALVLLSVRDPEEWYRSASNTVFLTFDNMPPELAPWMDAVRMLLKDHRRERTETFTELDLQVHGRLHFRRACITYNRARAQSPRAEFHSPVEPAHDLFLREQLGNVFSMLCLIVNPDVFDTLVV